MEKMKNFFRNFHRRKRRHISVYPPYSKIKRGHVFAALFFAAAVLIFVFQFFELTSFFTLSSSDYNVESAGTGLSGGTASSSSFSSSSSSGLQSSETTSNENFQGITGQPPATETTTETTTTTTTTSGSSGGGGASSTTAVGQCTNDWVCTEWYPEPCPDSGMQKRLCVNKGTCAGEIGMPETKRECVYEKPTGPLFDLLLSIPLSKKFISPQDSLTAELTLINVGDKKQLDVFLRYWIVDKNNNLIAEARETRAVTEKIKFNVKMQMPYGIEYGSYRFFAQIDYDENKTAIGEDSFQIVESAFPIYFQLYSVLLSVLLAVSVIAFSFFRFFGRNRHKDASI